MTTFHEVFSDVEAHGRWWLDAPKQHSGSPLSVWEFTSGKWVNPDRKFVIPILEHGTPLELTFTAFDTPVVNDRVAEVFRTFAADEVQILPAELETGSNLNILNITTVVNCFDAQRSSYTTQMDNLNRDTGQLVEPYPRIGVVNSLVLKRSEIGGHSVFRVRGWSLPLIASDVIVEILRRMMVTGFITVPVELSD
jgi:hypothetical protein